MESCRVTSRVRAGSLERILTMPWKLEEEREMSSIVLTFWSSVFRATTILSRPAYFKFDGPMTEIEMWRPWRQCISPKCLMSHLYPNGPSTGCPRRVTTVTYAYRVVGILRDDKQRRNRCYRKSNCKSFSLGKWRLELRTESQSV